MDGNAGSGFAAGPTVMGVTVNDQIGAMAIDDFGQARSAEEGEDLRSLSLDGGGNRGVMQDDNALLGP